MIHQKFGLTLMMYMVGETEVNISSTTLDASKENEKTIAKDDEEEMIAEDGKIVLPDCLCPIVHRYTRYCN